MACTSVEEHSEDAPGDYNVLKGGCETSPEVAGGGVNSSLKRSYLLPQEAQAMFASSESKTYNQPVRLWGRKVSTGILTTERMHAGLPHVAR